MDIDATAEGDVEIVPARREDGSHIAMLTDMAGHGLPAHFWATAGERAAGTSLLEIGRERARRDSGNFSWRNAWLARLDGDVAGVLLGYRQPADLDAGDLSQLPELVRPLVELEALAPGSWYLNVVAVYPEYRGRGVGRALMDKALAVSAEQGAPSTSLIVEDVNVNARRLYAAMGFEERALRPFVSFPFGPAAGNWILMVRDLR